MNNIVNFYEGYDEESRLTTNNSRKVEFTVITTIPSIYLQEY
ncbi:hypothetical protein CLHOM_27890 [Clostridium homopropionicum DSM 5847]|uniref:Uncharacterized protein n=1 Tax=Clostridium homopropionicum DSM 5847 TaxID=1121318 RepID=A0A0L6Z7A5_9CLOT|nr:hypothetical protein [Clostridium homopropionicum]KOA18850.1 hypothetical protein CLHOM_27890 [Clostridium homopropionicum DSM 5847]SFG90282.1 hypothetical protein SAMN04488501_12237 [Clostridium homopropionicum]